MVLSRCDRRYDLPASTAAVRAPIDIGFRAEVAMPCSVAGFSTTSVSVPEGSTHCPSMNCRPAIASIEIVPTRPQREAAKTGLGVELSAAPTALATLTTLHNVAEGLTKIPGDPAVQPTCRTLTCPNSRRPRDWGRWTTPIASRPPMSHCGGRLCQTDEMPSAIVFLCSDCASMITGSTCLSTEVRRSWTSRPWRSIAKTALERAIDGAPSALPG